MRKASQRAKKRKEYNHKYYVLFPYSTICKKPHIFRAMGYYQECSVCKWVKYPEEIAGERYVAMKLERIRAMKKINNMHISLFHF